jgi:catechol 2,3-dioxygenase-like lactoylglutathione lyase family enzyme
MLSSARCQAALPAADLDRARRFYEETLGFVPVDVQPRGVRYEAAEVTDLRSRGVVFETY